MLAGDLATAWAISDAVLDARDPATRDDPRLPYHLRWVWDGRPVDGRQVLVRCYHGLGDTLQFCRFLPALRRRAAAVTLEVQPALAPLLAGLADRVVPFDLRVPLPPAECDIEIMELAHALRLPPDQPAPALAVPAPGPSGIGLCWQAGEWNRTRSVSLEAVLQALPAGLRLVSLQRGPAASEAVSGRFINPHDADENVLRTASLILGATLVITVDTMVAHLAGVLGRPGLVLLPHAADWRWMRGKRCAWYPSLRLLRQARPGDWQAPLASLRDALAAGLPPLA
ncbi:conserved protein of unknown function [Rhodovastum atsumiense]|uniref:Glycosyltransferase family 9 protein n=1 Tax=Rhodovastum atsumiense TaxID=504468 RepID=A0A5M6IKQ7_9PROT|nr:hypothetical protein [Rhodovastum atsumiense]KAA5608840.1 hypothetical protein F1189_27020 [Rhodovastum atsumiense]CAH2599335.1 conserved protein of unknown function [Rhodovastum atsumiense]